MPCTGERPLPPSSLQQRVSPPRAPTAQLSAAASVTSTGTGDRIRFTPPLRTRLPGCHKPLFRCSGKAGCDFQPTTHAQDTAPLQQQSSRRVQEHGESKLAAVPGAPRCALGQGTQRWMRCSPCGGRGRRQRAQPPAFVTLPFVPSTWHPAQGAAATRRAVTGTGQPEGRQSPSSAARRVFRLRWQGGHIV